MRSGRQTTATKLLSDEDDAQLDGKILENMSDVKALVSNVTF